MTDPQHRKPNRKKGLALKGSTGRRRASGVLTEEPSTREELSKAARRRQAIRGRKRISFAVLIAAALILSAVLLSSWLQNRPTPAATSSPPVASVSDSGSSLLAIVVDDDGDATSIALVAASADGPDRVILIYPSLLVTLPGYGENLLSNAPRFGGAELAQVTLANLAGVRVDSVVIWSAVELETAIGQEVLVDLPAAFLVGEGDAEVVVAAAGETLRSPEELARFMIERGTASELDHLQRQGAVWRALLAAVAEDGDLADRLVGAADAVGEARTALVGVATGDPVVTLINAERIEPTGGGEERYQLDGGAAAEFVAEHVPYLRLAEEPRVRIEVLNGNGRIGTTRPVAGRLIDAGYRVVITDNADRDDYQVTRIIAQGRENQEAAVAIRELIGRGDVSIEVRQPSGVVDVTIVVGEDLPAGQG